MFVCIELDTDDTGIWATLERRLSEKLGLTNIIWGVNPNGDNIACHLPNNMFHAKIDITAKELFKPVKEVIESCWSYSYKVIISPSENWYHDTTTKSKPTFISPSKEEDSLEVPREE